MLEFDRLFETIAELVMLHSPSGVESEINQWLMEKFAALGVNAWLDRADNAIALIPGRNPQKSIAITAHKDEIGAIVKTVGSQGRVEVRRLLTWGRSTIALVSSKLTATRFRTNRKKTFAKWLTDWERLVIVIKVLNESDAPPSSRGLGHIPFTDATGIRIPLGVLKI